MKDFTAKDDAGLLDELEFEAEIQKIIQNEKSRKFESLNFKLTSATLCMLLN